MTQLWRVHLQTAGQDPRQFCIRGRIVGIGWPIDFDGEVDWPTYERMAGPKYKPTGKGWATALNALYHRMQIGDLCWTRDLDGIYYLGRVTSGWRYENDKRHRAADVVNVRDVSWAMIGTAESVPGTVLRHFIKGPTIRNIPDVTTVMASQLLYNRESKHPVYEILGVAADLYQLLSHWDLENLIALYLQSTEGYMIIPKTADVSAPKYEFAMIHKDGRRAALQVKGGKVDLNMDDYAAVAERLDEFYLFTATNSYQGAPNPKVRCLDPETIRAFANDHYHLMPGSIKLFMDLACELNRTEHDGT